MEKWNIQPGIGVGPLLLGMQMDDVIAAIGEPDAARTDEDSDGSNDEVWEYGTPGLILTFSDDYAWRLGAITVEEPSIGLAGHEVIGLSEEALVAVIEDEGLGELSVDDELEEIGLRAYMSEELSLCFWVVEETVASITVMPYYDSDGEVPRWPERDES